MDPLEQLWVAWQPIMDLAAGRAMGYESLIRGPEDTPLAMPAALFAWAHDAERAAALGQACKRLAYEGAQNRWTDPTHRVFLNIDARWAVLPDPWEQGRAGEIPLAVEVSETRSVMEDETLLAALDRWRRSGHLVVVDDYGAGCAGPGGVLALQPDIVKLDRILVAGIDHDVQKQSLVRAVRTWTDDLGIGLLAEGVETAGSWPPCVDWGATMRTGFIWGDRQRRYCPPPRSPCAAVWRAHVRMWSVSPPARRYTRSWRVAPLDRDLSGHAPNTRRRQTTDPRRGAESNADQGAGPPARS